MKPIFAMIVLACSVLSAAPRTLAGEDGTVARIHPGTFVPDSVITARIKTRLAGDHLTELGRIHVDTDKDGVVWLSGTAPTQAAIDSAIALTKATDGVQAVQSDIGIAGDE